MAKRLLSGINTSDEALSVDLIKEVGHEGKFLSHRHTLKWFPQEQFIPTPVIDRSTRREWNDQGQKSCRQRVKDIIPKMLENYRGKTIEPEIEEKLNDIMVSQEGFPEKLLKLSSK